MTKRYDYATQRWVEDEPYVAPPKDWAMDAPQHHVDWPERYPNPTEPVDLPKWPGGPAMDASPSASNETKEITVTEQTKEVNIEDPNMLSQIFAKLSSKVVEASDLAKRVGELEAQVQNLTFELSKVREDVTNERNAHALTSRELQDFRNRLDHEQRAVHDLVVERDMERDAKGQAQASLATANSDVAFWNSEAARLEKEKNEAVHASDVCREQREQMAGQVKALQSAFKALQVIG